MKQLLLLVSCGCLTLGLASFGFGCSSSQKCDSSSACTGDCSDCKDDCKGDCKDSGACKDGAKAAAAGTPVNKICPLGGHDADPKITATYQGKTIAFCCDDCKQEFLGKDDKGKSEILAKATGQ